MTKKEYLGDGAYVEYDGWNIILSTSNGIEETNRVYLEPPCLERFLQFLEEIKNNEQ